MGFLDARLVIVGEVPGKQEVEEGRPFVGRARKLRDGILEEAGVDRSKTYVSNIIKLGPTTENNGSFKDRPHKTGGD